MQNEEYNVCFIISHKYYRNYQSYIQYYVNNIQKFYPDSLCIIVDNNSTYISDIINKFKQNNNIIILSNVSLCKFELGAYKFGLYYLIEQDLLKKYDYIVFSQDTYILKNKYDFNEMKNNNILAMSFGSGYDGDTYGFNREPDYQKILNKFNLHNFIDKLGICWSNSFILHNSTAINFLNLTEDMVLTTRFGSMITERTYDIILFHLNGNKRYSLNNIEHLSYDCWKINLIEDNVSEYFAKRVQQKNENTPDI